MTRSRLELNEENTHMIITNLIEDAARNTAEDPTIKTWNKRLLSSVSVSYTHLTLPTIYSV